MFNDIGPLELVTLVVLAVLVFGPDKLPKMIQDVTRTIRKIREFSESAKADIRDELGPEFKDFEFEDLNPKTFLRKQLDNDELGLKEIRNGFDLKKEMAEVTDAVHSRESDSSASVNGSAKRLRRHDEEAREGRPGRAPALRRRRHLIHGVSRPPPSRDAEPATACRDTGRHTGSGPVRRGRKDAPPGPFPPCTRPTRRALSPPLAAVWLCCPVVVRTEGRPRGRATRSAESEEASGRWRRQVG